MQFPNSAIEPRAQVWDKIQRHRSDWEKIILTVAGMSSGSTSDLSGSRG
jgi:hypothetical protein